MTVQDVAVIMLNASLMFSVGLELEPAKMRAAARQRSTLLAFLVLNFAVIPVFAFALTTSMGLAPAIAAGILLSAVAPGGGTGTLLTRAARGNLELSVVALGMLTLLAVVFTPVLTLATLPALPGGELRLGPVIQTLVLYQLLPLAVGIGTRLRSLVLAERANTIARPLSNVVFAALVLGLLLTRGHLVLEVGLPALLGIIALVVASLWLPAGLAEAPADRSALALTTGVRNLSLALLLSTTFFDDLTTITVLTYGLWMYMLAVPWALVARRNHNA